MEKRCKFKLIPGGYGLVIWFPVLGQKKKKKIKNKNKKWIEGMVASNCNNI